MKPYKSTSSLTYTCHTNTKSLSSRMDGWSTRNHFKFQPFMETYHPEIWERMQHWAAILEASGHPSAPTVLSDCSHGVIFRVTTPLGFYEIALSDIASNAGFTYGNNRDHVFVFRRETEDYNTTGEHCYWEPGQGYLLACTPLEQMSLPFDLNGAVRYDTLDQAFERIISVMAEELEEVNRVTTLLMAASRKSE